jgi:hypothetical protein
MPIKLREIILIFLSIWEEQGFSPRDSFIFVRPHRIKPCAYKNGISDLKK